MSCGEAPQSVQISFGSCGIAVARSYPWCSQCGGAMEKTFMKFAKSKCTQIPLLHLFLIIIAVKRKLGR